MKDQAEQAAQTVASTSEEQKLLNGMTNWQWNQYGRAVRQLRLKGQRITIAQVRAIAGLPHWKKEQVANG